MWWWQWETQVDTGRTLLLGVSDGWVCWKTPSAARNQVQGANYGQRIKHFESHSFPSAKQGRLGMNTAQYQIRRELKPITEQYFLPHLFQSHAEEAVHVILAWSVTIQCQKGFTSPVCTEVLLLTSPSKPDSWEQRQSRQSKTSEPDRHQTSQDISAVWAGSHRSTQHCCKPQGPQAARAPALSGRHN